MALRGQERVRHAAADEELVDLRQQRLDDAEFVGDLRAAEHHRVGMLRVAGERAQHLDLGEHQAAGVGGQPLCDVVDRRLLAVHHAETVGDEGGVRADQRGQLVGQRAALGIVLAGLAGFEADVLQQRDRAVGQPGDHRLRRVAHQVGGQRDIGAEQFAEPPGDRGQRELRVRLTLGPPQVRGQHHLGAGLGQLLDRRQGRAHPAVVGDLLAVQRHVEVGAHQDTPTPNALGQQIVKVLHVCSSHSYGKTRTSRGGFNGSARAGLKETGFQAAKPLPAVDRHRDARLANCPSCRKRLAAWPTLATGTAAGLSGFLARTAPPRRIGHTCAGDPGVEKAAEVPPLAPLLGSWLEKPSSDQESFLPTRSTRSARRLE